MNRREVFGDACDGAWSGSSGGDQAVESLSMNARTNAHTPVTSSWSNRTVGVSRVSSSVMQAITCRMSGWSERCGRPRRAEPRAGPWTAGDAGLLTHGIDQAPPDRTVAGVERTLQGAERGADEQIERRGGGVGVPGQRDDQLARAAPAAHRLHAPGQRARASWSPRRDGRRRARRAPARRPRPGGSTAGDAPPAPARSRRWRGSRSRPVIRGEPAGHARAGRNFCAIQRWIENRFACPHSVPTSACSSSLQTLRA